MIINEDNQSTICIAKGTNPYGKTKHISIKYHFVRYLVKENSIKLVYCHTSEMLADLFTKPIACEKFVKLRHMVGMSSLALP